MSHKKYLEAMKSKEGTLKIGKNRKLIEYIENSMLNDRNSPYVALEKAKKENIEVNICLKTLYNYIHKQLFINFSEKNMIYKKNRRKQEKNPKRIREIGGRSIEERAEEINNREEVGRFEVDTIYSAHRGIIDNPKLRIDELKKHYADRNAEIYNLLKEVEENSAAQMAAKMHWDYRAKNFEEFPNNQKWFATGEALANLEHLRAIGKADYEFKDGVAYYRIKERT